MVFGLRSAEDAAHAAAVLAALQAGYCLGRQRRRSAMLSAGPTPPARRVCRADTGPLQYRIGNGYRHGASASWPEEFQLDVVGVAECHHRCRGVDGLLDPRVSDIKLVEVGDPSIEFVPAGDEELQVVEPNPVFVEAIATNTWSTQKTELEAGSGFYQVHLQCAVRTGLTLPR